MPPTLNVCGHCRLVRLGLLSVALGVGALALARLGLARSSGKHALVGSTSRSGEQHLLEVSPDPLLLGSIAKGDAAESTFHVYNTLPEAVRIERVDTSCPCVTVNTRSTWIAPGERRPSSSGTTPARLPIFRISCR
jgi:hypothetical protein